MEIFFSGNERCAADGQLFGKSKCVYWEQFFLLLRLGALIMNLLELATGLKVVHNIPLAQLNKPCAQK